MTINDLKGQTIRTLAGHQPARVYHSRSRAAYWDGGNQQVEASPNGDFFRANVGRFDRHAEDVSEKVENLVSLNACLGGIV